MLQSDVLDHAKVLASALAIQFGNDETGQINPSLATLCAYLRVSEDTARRAIADLVEAGWLARNVGRGRGHRSSFALLSPGNVVPLRPASPQVRPAEKIAAASDKSQQRCGVKARGKGSSVAPKSSQPCNSPYKAEQSSEQRTGSRPAAHLRAFVKSGSWQADDWNCWLSDLGQRAVLDDLKALHEPGGYCLPWSTPPKPHQETETRLALLIIDWAKKEADLHALRYRGVMELAWAGCDDDEIMSYSGHSTKAMVVKYAGEARQIMRAQQAREKRR